MTTSNSTDYSRTGLDLVNAAYRKIRYKPGQESLPAFQLANGLEALNLMLKAWNAQGLHLWKQADCVMFLDAGTPSYQLYSSGDHASTSYIQTALNGAASSSATSLTVDSTAGMTVGDYIGIELSSGSLHWTTIATIPGTASLTITLGLVGAASDNAVVFTYTTRLAKPMRVLAARRKQSDGTETEITLIPRNEYMRMSNKTNQGTPVQFYFSPQLSYGQMSLWPAPSVETDVIKFTAELSIQDFDTSSNTPDLPQEWYESIVYNLAVRLAPEVGIALSSIQDVVLMADQSLKNLLDWDQELGSVSFEPVMYGDY